MYIYIYTHTTACVHIYIILVNINISCNYGEKVMDINIMARHVRGASTWSISSAIGLRFMEYTGLMPRNEWWQMVVDIGIYWFRWFILVCLV